MLRNSIVLVDHNNFLRVMFIKYRTLANLTISKLKRSVKYLNMYSNIRNWKMVNRLFPF